MASKTDTDAILNEDQAGTVARRRIEVDETRKRMDRLEDRLDDSILGNDGLAQVDDSSRDTGSQPGVPERPKDETTPDGWVKAKCLQVTS